MEHQSGSVDTIKTQFASQGFVCVPGVLTAAECAAWLAVIEAEKRPPRDWYKGHAASSRAYYEVAVHWPLVQMVQAVLGPDVVLWGASLIKRSPGEVHLWHSDMESSLPEGRTASLWIGLRHTTAESSLKVLAGSHAFGVTVQEMAARAGVARSEVTDERVAAWGADRGAKDGPQLVPMTDGDVLLFDGRLWHGSHNLSPELGRVALLLQYAEAGTRIRKVDVSNKAWPYDFIESPLPPCLPVSGSTEGRANRTVAPPLLPCAMTGGRLTGRVCPLELPLPGVGDGAFSGHASAFQMRGHTHALADLSCHVSALAPGASPHPPHQHPEEEILLVLDGEVEVWLPGLDGTEMGSRQRLRRGEVVYYPAGFYHTLTATGERPAHYLMLRWISDPVTERPALSHRRQDALGLVDELKRQGKGANSQLQFEGATSWLQKLHCHTTVMDPGAGYEPHEDPYDVLIVVLEGEVETLGQRVVPHGVIYYATGEPHGMRNPGTEPATYVVFELHGSDRAAVRLGTDFTLKDGELAAATRKLAEARKEVKALKKELKRREKAEKKRLKPRPQLKWHQKLFSSERWGRRLKRWTGRGE